MLRSHIVMGDRTVWCWTIWCRTIRCGQFGVGQLGAGQLGAGQLGAMDNLVWGPNWTIRCRTIRCRTIRCDGQLGATISVAACCCWGLNMGNVNVSCNFLLNFEIFLKKFVPRYHFLQNIFKPWPKKENFQKFHKIFHEIYHKKYNFKVLAPRHR